MYMVNFMIFLLMMILSLVGVAFVTLLERKILGYLQFRKGPNKVGISGIFQPFSDAIKLYTKEFFFPLKANFMIYWISPFLSIAVSLIVWVIFPYYYSILSWKFSILFMFLVLSLSVYGMMLSGWSSHSNYALLGTMRSLAQSISYEVSFFILVLNILFFIFSLQFSFWFYQQMIWFIYLLSPIMLMIFTSLLAELNRTPFDFSEGESELVSGFNIEYGGSGFAFIFLAEYLSIIFSSILFTMLFLGGNVMEINFYMKVNLIVSLIIIIRGSLPRYRYDKLMNMCWKVYLSNSLFLIIFYSSFSL